MADPVYYPSHKPSFLAPEHALVRNGLLLRPFPREHPFGAGTIRLEPLPEAPVFSPACTFDLDLGGRPWIVDMSDTGPLLLHSVFLTADDGGNAPDVHALPPEVLRALLGSLLEPVLPKLRACLGDAVTVTDVRFPPFPGEGAVPFSLGFRACFPACGHLPEQVLFLRLSPRQAESASVLAERLRHLPLRSRGPLSAVLKSVPLEVAFESGYVLLNLRDAASLAPDDVLLPDVWTAPEQLTLRILRGPAGWLTAPCTFKEGNAVIASPLSEEPEPFMDNPDQKDIDIRLSFELDRRLITVGELETLAPGYTFSLPCDAQTPVTIRANGKAIARGRLVDMNGTLGVQIAETL